jgi:hypothetical protein
MSDLSVVFIVFYFLAWRVAVEAIDLVAGLVEPALVLTPLEKTLIPFVAVACALLAAGFSKREEHSQEEQ